MAGTTQQPLEVFCDFGREMLSDMVRRGSQSKFDVEELYYVRLVEWPRLV